MTDRVIRYAMKHGPWVLVAGFLIWWLTGSLSAQLTAHETTTERVLEKLNRICVNTAVVAQRDPGEACFRRMP